MMPQELQINLLLSPQISLTNDIKSTTKREEGGNITKCSTESSVHFSFEVPFRYGADNPPYHHSSVSDGALPTTSAYDRFE
ncbi:hypothetical protein CEXT_584501 [Caerostris extrusa]|uniref:Uncharacterized protein n=1 Tax=Caerostris extrusa TaxID=172846 RepID=A0AAV4U6T4_CAEEX|nr:hypothetical protein CEXT_584501 [Caerostris extrusa]